jgi:BioD-like phosphotransacetylase family protein
MMMQRNISNPFVKTMATKTTSTSTRTFLIRHLSTTTNSTTKSASTTGIDTSNSNRQRPIFVAATKQHVGKTSVSLSLLSGLQKRFDKVGFIKPVGQQHVPVHSTLLNKSIRVDKDVCLMKERFNLHHLDYEHMSPVIIPRGYTKKYIDGKIHYEGQLEKVLEAFKHVNNASDVVLCEGTGHCAVGSIVGVNNAQVAAMMGADMVLIANGGLGSAFDELELNRVLCQHYNVRIAGVVINKVIPSKYDQTKHYMSKALMDRWGVPLLGVIPDRPFLGCPALMDLESIFDTTLITGDVHRFRHYNVADINLVTTSLTRFLENLRNKPTRTLYICHVTRDDLILGFMSEYQRRKAKGECFESALVVCGRKEKYEMIPEVKDMIVGLDGAPVMIVEHSTHKAMSMIHRYTPKFNVDDKHRVTTAVEHYEPYIDFDELLRRTHSTDSSFNEPGVIQMDELRKK